MAEETKTQPETKKKSFFSVLGPGIVTGAADDDPSGIVTYTQAGAKFGFGQLWTLLFSLPLMIAVQEACARIGVVTGKGLSRLIKENYSKKLLYFIVLLLLVVNTINLGADLGAMAEAVKLFLPLPFTVIALAFFVLILGLEIYLPYHKYAKVLKWLTISLFAYFITGFIVAGNWGAILKATFVPQLHFNSQFLFLLVGVIGTTISPYMFFWQASQEVEEEKDAVLTKHQLPDTTAYISNMRLDVFLGMFFSNLTAWFIMITAAAVLNVNSITEIHSAAQAAQALEPLVRNFPHAGVIAQMLFALGVVGTGLLAIPIFAATSSYAVSEIFNWREGLANKFSQAKNFYLVIIVGTLIGLLINFIGINPIKVLVYTAVLNGIVALPMLVVIMRIGNSKKLMGQQTSGKWSNILITITFIAMLGAVLGSIYLFFRAS